MPLKVALIGYGQMGREIEADIPAGIVITAKYDIDFPLPEKIDVDFDVALDFSHANSVVENARILAKNKRNIVIGTTGWYDAMPEVEAIVKEAGICCVWGSNFSIGVNIFFKIVERAAKLLNYSEGFDIAVNEIHHKRKRDSPSGSAITLSEIIMKEFPKKKHTNFEPIQGKITPDTLHVSSTRVGEVIGTHSIYIDSQSDSIELTHRAKNRMGLATGAINAAEWTIGKTGFHSFNDVIIDILG